MATKQQDTEITLGTGRMLAIFFTFVLVCAFFFAIGFSLGRRTTLASASDWPGASGGAPATVVRPAAKTAASSAPAPAVPANDFSFYKAVGAKNADSGLTPSDATTQNSKAQSASSNAAATNQQTPPKDASVATTAAPAAAGYYVQVAAVTRQEDAESLVEALKRKQYPAFSANNPTADKFYHVLIGPYTDMKEAEAMRARLVRDGYNPIVKK